MVSCVLVQFFNSLQTIAHLDNFLPNYLKLIKLEIRIRFGTGQKEHIYNWDHKIDREKLIVLYHP